MLEMNFGLDFQKLIESCSKGPEINKTRISF